MKGATNGNSDSTTSTSGQAAFLQGGDGTATDVAFSQQLTFGGPTEITFSAESRYAASNYGNTDTINVYLDGTEIGSVTPSTTIGAFQTFKLPIDYVAGGTHTLTFAGDNLQGGDSSSFVDNVSVTVVPEPSSIVAFWGLGAVGLILAAFRRRMA